MTSARSIKDLYKTPKDLYIATKPMKEICIIHRGPCSHLWMTCKTYVDLCISMVYFEGSLQSIGRPIEDLHGLMEGPYVHEGYGGPLHLCTSPSE